MKKIEI